MKNLSIIVSILLVLLNLAGCAGPGEDAQKAAEEFVTDIYAVSPEEVDNYKHLLSLNTADAKELAEAVQANDSILKSLMTGEAYVVLLKNRENLMFAQACYEGNYTIQVMELKLSENTYNIEENRAGYNYEVQLRLKSEDGASRTESAKGFVGLTEENDRWKVSEYRNTVPDFIMDTLNTKRV